MDQKRPREAAALEYDPTSAAPRIVATGKGVAAEKIVEKAEELGIPVHQDPEVAHALNMLRIGDEIPAELYTVVAQIMLFVCDVDKLMDKK